LWAPLETLGKDFMIPKHEAKGSMKRYRKTQRGGGFFSALEHEQAVAAKSTGILKLRDLIPWESFRSLLEELTGYAMRDWCKGGKPPFEGMSADSLKHHADGEMIFVWFRADARRLRRETGSCVPAPLRATPPRSTCTAEPVSRAPKATSPS